MVLRKIIGCKRVEGWREQYNEEIHNLNASQNIIIVQFKDNATDGARSTHW